MTKLIQGAIALLLLVATAAIAGVSWYGCYALQQWGAAASNVDAITDALTRPCGNAAQKPCGTLADVNRTLGTVRGAVGQIETAARHENRQLTVLDGQERQLFDDLHSTVLEAQGTLKDSRETIRAATGFAQDASGAVGTLNESLKQTRPFIDDLGATARDLDRRVNDPHVDALMSHLSAVAAHGDAIAGNIDRMSGHIEQKVDAPVTWKTRAEAGSFSAAKLLVWWLTR